MILINKFDFYRLKTSVIKLKFKADHLAAVSHYEEAGNYF